MQCCGAGAGRSRAFTGEAGAEIFYLEPEPKKKYLEPMKNGSAPQHCIDEYRTTGTGIREDPK